MVGRLFGLDPIAVLDSPPDIYELRLACAEAALEQIRQEEG